MLKEFTIFLKIENLAVDEVHKRKYLVQPGKPLIMGRSKECHIVLIDENVSRKHSMLKVDGDTLMVKDLDSGNGTFLDGEKVTYHALHEGQLIVVGGFEIRIMKLVGAPSNIVADDIIIEEDTKEVRNVSTSEKDKNRALPKNIQPDLKEPSAAERGLEGEDIWQGKLNVDGFKNILVDAWKLLLDKQLDFFKVVPLAGTQKNSLGVIVISTTIPTLILLLLNSSESLEVIINSAVGLVFAVGGTYASAKIMDVLKNWMEIKNARFENFLRFYAYSSLIALPIGLLGAVPIVGAFVGLIGLGLSILFLIGFYIRFNPVIGKYIVACILVFVVNGIASFGASLVAPTPEIEIPQQGQQKELEKNVFKRLKGERKNLEDTMFND